MWGAEGDPERLSGVAGAEPGEDEAGQWRPRARGRPKTPLPCVPRGRGLWGYSGYPRRGEHGAPRKRRGRRAAERQLHDLIPGFPNPGARWHLQAPASQEASFPRSADRVLLSWGGGDGGGAPRRADGSCRPLGSRGGVRPGARGQSSLGPSARPLPGKVCGRTRRKGETCRTARRGRAGTCRLMRERPQRI